MDWKGIANWLVSGLGIGLAAFCAAAFLGGIPTKDSIVAGLSAAGAAMVQHLRNKPFSSGGT